jgi:hypothetical protein
MISLEHVERKLEEADDSYRRIEGFPPPDEMLDIVPPNPAAEGLVLSEAEITHGQPLARATTADLPSPTPAW